MKRNSLVYGTILLTITGLITRVIGFFYRIFLSHIYGETGMCIYQLTSPVITIVYAFTSAGIQTAVSKFVAATPENEVNHKARKRGSSNLCLSSSALSILISSSLLSLFLSVFCSVFVIIFRYDIATILLGEKRTAPLLMMIAFSFPFSAIHSCINGYYYGIHKTIVPSLSQLLEQIGRVGSVYFLFLYAQLNQYHLTLSGAMFGMAIGEIISMTFSISALFLSTKRAKKNQLQKDSTLKYVDFKKISSLNPRLISYNMKRVIKMSTPLTLNRIVLTLLSSVETIFLPKRLLLFGLSIDQSLSLYGVLTGMALPLIFFPSALTGSVSVLLLPIVSEAESVQNTERLASVIIRTVKYTLYFGFFCTIIFFLGGKIAGNILFHSSLAGFYIQNLSFICPFLYLGTTLSSILHGLGKTTYTFLCNIVCLSLRITGMMFLVPIYGMKGYLWTLLIYSILISFLYFLALSKFMRYNNPKSKEKSRLEKK